MWLLRSANYQKKRTKVRLGVVKAKELR